MTVRILQGDCRDVLKTLPDESVHCVVTSPPYWGLRDYGVAGQIGSEETVEAFVEVLVDVFREVRRVLRMDGTAWVNMGDCYASTPPGCGAEGVSRSSTLHGQVSEAYRETLKASVGQKRNTIAGGLKPKDLVGQPWRLAFALQADGWWLRQDIIWHKPNPMPESIRDRCTKAHEYVFLLAKSERYYYDFGAMQEPASENTNPRRSVKMPDGWDTGPGGHGSFHRQGREKGKTTDRRPKAWDVDMGSHRTLIAKHPRKLAEPGSGTKNNSSMDEALSVMPETRNKRSVWTVTTAPFKEAHFATFPPDLIEPCILAGCPEGGTVLDPFGGAGTTGLVADRLHRDAILIELNPEYAEMARNRIFNDAPLFADVA